MLFLSRTLVFFFFFFKPQSRGKEVRKRSEVLGSHSSRFELPCPENCRLPPKVPVYDPIVSSFHGKAMRPVLVNRSIRWSVAVGAPVVLEERPDYYYITATCCHCSSFPIDRTAVGKQTLTYNLLSFFSLPSSLP